MFRRLSSRLLRAIGAIACARRGRSIVSSDGLVTTNAVRDVFVMLPTARCCCRNCRRRSNALGPLNGTSFRRELKHLDAVAGENGVSLSPPFAEFETNELSLTVRGEVYHFNAEAFFQINPALLGSLVDFALRRCRRSDVFWIFIVELVYSLFLWRASFKR